MSFRRAALVSGDIDGLDACGTIASSISQCGYVDILEGEKPRMSRGAAADAHDGELTRCWLLRGPAAVARQVTAVAVACFDELATNRGGHGGTSLEVGCYSQVRQDG